MEIDGFPLAAVRLGGDDGSDGGGRPAERGHSASLPPSTMRSRSGGGHWMLEPDWLPAREVYRRLIDVGVPARDVARALAFLCQQQGLIATGFGRVHIGDEIRHRNRRQQVNSRAWRALQIEKPEVEAWVSWDAGELTWTMTVEGKSTMQETWQSVHFDRISIDSAVWQMKVRAEADAMHDYEIDAWIENDCRASDVKKAWKQLTTDVGTSRRGKWTIFNDRWKEKTGHRPRGKPRKTTTP